MNRTHRESMRLARAGAASDKCRKRLTASEQRYANQTPTRQDTASRRLSESIRSLRTGLLAHDISDSSNRCRTGEQVGLKGFQNVDVILRFERSIGEVLLVRKGNLRTALDRKHTGC